MTDSRNPAPADNRDGGDQVAPTPRPPGRRRVSAFRGALGPQPAAPAPAAAPAAPAAPAPPDPERPATSKWTCDLDQTTSARFDGLVTASRIRLGGATTRDGRRIARAELLRVMLALVDDDASIRDQVIDLLARPPAE